MLNLNVLGTIMVDAGSRAASVTIHRVMDVEHGLGNVTGEIMLAPLLNHWVKYNGKPDVLRTDLEEAFRDQGFRRGLAAKSIRLDIDPGEAPRKTGVLGKTLDTIKQSAIRVDQRKTDSVTIQEIFDECAAAHKCLACGDPVCVCGGDRSSGCVSQSKVAVSLKPDIRPWCVSGCQSCHGKARTADAMCRLDAPGLGSPETRIPRGEESSEEDRPSSPAKTTDRSHRDFFYKRLSSRTARTKGPFTWESSVQIRLASLSRNFRDRMRDPPGSRARCLSSVQCVRTSKSKGALLGASVPAIQRFSTIPAISQIQCLDLGAWAEQTAPALGAQTVPTTKIRI